VQRKRGKMQRPDGGNFLSDKTKSNERSDEKAAGESHKVRRGELEKLIPIL